MGYMPFENTKIDQEQSIAMITGQLVRVGFSQTGHVCKEGKYRVVASDNDATFVFQIDQDAILEKLISGSSDRRQRHIRGRSEEAIELLRALNERAGKIGWRLLAEHVKALCDSIRLGVVTISQAFAGHLLLQMHSKRAYTMADFIAEQAAAGKLNSPDLLKPLLLPERHGKEPKA